MLNTLDMLSLFDGEKGLSESFTYSNGLLEGNGTWTLHSSTSSGAGSFIYPVVSSNLLYQYNSHTGGTTGNNCAKFYKHSLTTSINRPIGFLRTKFRYYKTGSNGGSFSITPLDSEGVSTATVSVTSGGVVFFGGSGSYNFTMNNDIWYNFEYVVDNTQSLLYVWADGQEKPSNPSATSFGYLPSISHILMGLSSSFATSVTGSVTHYVDNVEIIYN